MCNVKRRRQRINRYGKTGNKKSTFFFLQHCCKTSWIAMLRISPPCNRWVSTSVVKLSTSLMNLFYTNVGKQVASFLFFIFITVVSGQLAQKNTFHVSHTFLYISLPLFCTTTGWNLVIRFIEELSYVFLFAFFNCCSVSPLWPLAFLIFSHPHPGNISPWTTSTNYIALNLFQHSA